ncbi:MAG TPA: hypothetical protein VNR70_11355 [Steroidobacteraceae bacterium]|nr:hypothetical protein [Steroidobacteraceae bacterium]
MQVKAAIGSFFVEFSRFEILSVGMALRSLSKDSLYVEHAEQLLDLEARFKLLERMAFARAISTGLAAELDALLMRARRLCAERDEVARNSARFDSDPLKPYSVPTPGKPKPPKTRSAGYARLEEIGNLLMPTPAQIQAYTNEAIQLQEAFRAISEKIDEQLLAANAQAETGVE